VDILLVAQIEIEFFYHVRRVDLIPTSCVSLECDFLRDYLYHAPAAGLRNTKPRSSAPNKHSRLQYSASPTIHDVDAHETYSYSSTRYSYTTYTSTINMAIIWGLDLREIQWAKFKNSYMWNNEYHMRRTKFIIYQLAMILCVVSESLGTAALSGTF